MLARRLSGWQDRYPDVVVHKVVVCDRPAPRLLELAQTAQLVVVGSHGRGGGSPACISAQSAERWSIPVRLRLSSPESPKIRQCRPEGLCDLLGWCPPARKAPSEP